MLFFNSNASEILESPQCNKEKLAANNYYEVMIPHFNTMLYSIKICAEELIFNSDIKKFIFKGTLKKVSDYDERYLQYVKETRAEAFSKTFAEVDAKLQRPCSTVLSALVDGEDLPEPDADLLWQFEAVKAENRKLMAQLNAATTGEEAEAIKPWMPWDAPNSQ